MDKIITIFYILIWLSLLVHCLMKERFFPILGTGWSTKILWLFTFALFSPVLSVLYLVFGVIAPAPSGKRKNPLVRILSILALLLIIVVSVFSRMPAIGKDTGPVTISKDSKPEEHKKLLAFEVHAGALRSNNSFSNSTFSSHSGNARFACRNAVIMCQSDHPMMDKAARLIQEELAAKPGIEKVTYYPADYSSLINRMLPDIYITLDMPYFKESASPLGRKIDATISCYVGNALNPGHAINSYSDGPPVVNFGFNGTLKHGSQFGGITSQQAKYSQQARDIAEQITKSFNKLFNDYKDKHGLMPKMPQYLYGTDMEGPVFPFVNLAPARKIISGSGLMLNNHTIWMFDDNRDTLEVLKDCRDQLIAKGYKGGSELDKEQKYPVEHVSMSKGDIHIDISRQRQNDQRGGTFHSGHEILHHSEDGSFQDPKPMPMVVHYRSLFTRQQTDELMDKVLDSDMDIDTLMIFERFFRSSEQKQKLLTKIENNTFKSMGSYLAVTNIYLINKDVEKAKEAFLMARVMGRAEKEHNPRQSDINSIAKKLGDKSLAKQEIPMEYFTKAGFIDITDATEPAVIEVKPPHPAVFFFKDSNGEIATLAMRIQPIACSSDKDSEKQYELIKILKTKSYSSVGSRNPFIGSTLEHTQNFGIIKFEIEHLQDEKFRISAYPAEKYTNNQI